MKFKQIRNATVRIAYAGKKFLVDPMLAEKGAYPGFAGTVNSQQSNPTVGLPVSLDEILDVDAVIVTHMHPDHWDDAARTLLPKDIMLFVQNTKDAGAMQAAGFRNIRVLEDGTVFDGITLIKTTGQHGRGKVLQDFGEILGEVCGVVFQHPQERTLYVAGDTVWYEGVAANLKQYNPDVIVLNSGDAKILPDEPIIMGKQDVYEVYRAAPHATIIASHMEALNHSTLSRKDLREFLREKGMTQRVLVPDDGESYSL